jgi:hypothetical protein
MATAQALPMPSVTPYRKAVRFLEKYFYFVMSLLIAAVVVFGFSHTIGRRLIYAEYRRPTLVWVHALLFFGWVVFYILQSSLVRIGKVRLHRTLGWAGAALGVSMVVVGCRVAVVMARFDALHFHANKEAFLIVQFFDMFAFAVALGLAILWRKNTAIHRPLMLLATCVLTDAAFGRIPGMGYMEYSYSGVDALILLGGLRDLAVNRRIHNIYLASVPLLLAGEAATVYILRHKPAFWMRFAHAVIG